MISKAKNIAIIGTGISGLSTAHMLHPHHNITLYEKNDYIGGHSRTISVKTKTNIVPVDTGFIVFNYRNYPYLSQLFTNLNVPIAKSDMSFGASILNGKFEYGTQALKNIFAQKSNLYHPQFWKMIFDILKFNKKAKKYLENDEDITLGQCLHDLKMGAWFKDYYILAMGAAIWSTPVLGMLDFPAKAFIQFFENHGLLSLNDQPQWYTVQNGSQEYVKRLSAPFLDKILLNCGVIKIQRKENKVYINDERGQITPYDEVIFACHSDQALRLIDKPNEKEADILGALTYQPNKMILHSDISFMPKRKKAWASWVYLSEGKKDNKQNISLSYWMNNLQPLQTNMPMIVTLNPMKRPDPALIHDEYIFHHPVFDQAAIKAQQRIDEIQGQNKFWFCGAYQGNGFHEDGLLSAVNMVAKMGIKPQWM